MEETTKFRSEPKVVSQSEVGDIIKKYDFYSEVRNISGQGFNNDFIEQVIQGEKIVIDKASELMWQQSGSKNLMSYEDAIRFINEINRAHFANYSNWRLPTIEEGMSLVKPKEMLGILHIHPLFDKNQGVIWTSDFDVEKRHVWAVTFYGGGCLSKTHDLNYSYVRAVRSV
jgi:serine/threonine-protein kinase